MKTCFKYTETADLTPNLITPDVVRFRITQEDLVKTDEFVISFHIKMFTLDYDLSTCLNIIKHQIIRSIRINKINVKDILRWDINFSSGHYIISVTINSNLLNKSNENKFIVSFNELTRYNTCFTIKPTILNIYCRYYQI